LAFRVRGWMVLGMSIVLLLVSLITRGDRLLVVWLATLSGFGFGVWLMARPLEKHIGAKQK
jgi:hypothetical protein